MRLVVLLVLSACAGTSGPAQPEPPPGPASPDPGLPEAATPEPPRVIPDAGAPDALPVVHPGVRGFFCVERVWRGDRVTRCFRSLENCEQVLADAKAKGFDTGSACKPADRAFCFGYFSSEGEATYWRCSGTERDCLKNQGAFEEEFPEDQFSQCKLYSYVVTPAPARVSR